MNIDALYQELDEQKTLRDQSVKNIQKLEQGIAEILCPHKIGDRIQYSKNGKLYEGIVDKIHPVYKNPIDQIFATVHIHPQWCVSGQKINKTTASVGKHGFSVSPVYFSFDALTNIYVSKEIEDILFFLED